MKSILIVEDDPFLLKMYKTRFEQEHVQVETADNGDRALDLLAQKSFQVIILDLMLPKVGGLHILVKIKKSAQNKQAAVIVITSLGGDKHKKEALALGAKEYFDKVKYTPSQVVEAVKKYLQ